MYVRMCSMCACVGLYICAGVYMRRIVCMLFTRLNVSVCVCSYCMYVWDCVHVCYYIYQYPAKTLICDSSRW